MRIGKQLNIRLHLLHAFMENEMMEVAVGRRRECESHGLDASAALIRSMCPLGLGLRRASFRAKVNVRKL